MRYTLFPPTMGIAPLSTLSSTPQRAHVAQAMSITGIEKRGRASDQQKSARRTSVEWLVKGLQPLVCLAS